MSHFAKLSNENVVVQVLKMNNEMPNQGYDWLLEQFGGTWVQTSYNTFAGQHSEGGTPLRKNFAGIGYTYDSDKDAFIPPKPSETAVLDEDTCQWIEPEADES